MRDEPRTLGPHAPDPARTFAPQTLYESLVDFDINGEATVPRLARSWTISPDGLTYTFNLVRNATWHDGKPFTSADVAFSLTTIRKYYPYFVPVSGQIDRVDTPDPYAAVACLTILDFSCQYSCMHQEK